MCASSATVTVIAVNCVNLVYKKVQCDKDELLIMSVNIE